MWRERRLKEIAEAIKPAFAATDGMQWWLAGAETKPLPEPSCPADPRNAIAYVTTTSVQQPELSPIIAEPELAAAATEHVAAPVRFNQFQEAQSSVKVAEAPAAPAQTSEQQVKESAVAVETAAARVPLFEQFAQSAHSSSGRETRKFTWDSKRGCFV
jgi:hypothetical protein